MERVAAAAEAQLDDAQVAEIPWPPAPPPPATQGISSALWLGAMAAKQSEAPPPPPPITCAPNEDPHTAWANAAKWTVAPAADELPPLDAAAFAGSQFETAQLGTAAPGVLAAAAALQHQEDGGAGERMGEAPDEEEKSEVLASSWLGWSGGDGGDDRGAAAAAVGPAAKSAAL